MVLSNLSYTPGAIKSKKRVGRGDGSGHGTTSCRGQNGSGARASKKLPYRGFEGGQMPLQRRIPKRGFTNIFRKELAIVNISDLELKFNDGDVVSIKALLEKNILKSAKYGLKVLGKGNLTKKLEVKARKFSQSAKEKIEAAGGKVEVI